MTPPDGSVVLTGGNGFLGQAIRAQFDATGIGYVGFFRGISEGSSDQLRTVVVDLEDRHQVFEAMEFLPQVKGIVHAAALARFRSRSASSLWSANVTATQNLCDAIGAFHPDAYFLHVSTIGVLDRPWGHVSRTPLGINSPCSPTSLYGKSKLESERVVRTSGLRHSIVRLPWVYGTAMRRDSHLRWLQGLPSWTRHLLWLVAGGRVSVIEVNDAADLIRILLDQQPLDRIVHAAEPAPVSLRQVLIRSSKRTARQTQFTPGSLFGCLLPFSLRALVEDALVFEGREANFENWRPSYSFSRDWSTP